MKFSWLAISLFISSSGWTVGLDSLKTEKRGDQLIVIHQVDPGETLYSITHRYHVNISNVIEVNNIQHNNIRSGQILEIPIQTAKHEQTLDVVPKKEGTKIHVVETGETLSAIGRKYGIKADQIIAWNKLTSESINPGQELSIGLADKKSPFIPFEGALKHYVQPGENLLRIAQMRNINGDSLRKWNNLLSNDIKIGQILWYQSYDRSNEPIVEKEVFGKHSVEGIAMQIDDMEDTDKYLALHKELPTGTLLEVRNLMNNKKVYVRVVGQLPATGLNENILIRLTPISFKRMGILDARARVELTYYDE